MLSKLQQGTTLVVDRYSFSGAVFTAAKQIPGLDLKWTKVSLLLPDFRIDKGILSNQIFTSC